MREFSLQNKKLLLGLAAVLFILIVASSLLMSSPPKIMTQADQPLNILAMGNLRPLDKAIEENSDIRKRVKDVLAVDTASIFTNYRQVNGIVAEILFLWAEMTPEQLQKFSASQSIDYFLRYVYGLAKDEPTRNNPLMGRNPWPKIFSRYKTRLLMMGNGYNIYEGEAYYNSLEDRMVINGTLREDFVAGFSQFLSTQSAERRQRTLNNFLNFIDETKGLDNLTVREQSMISVLKKTSG